MATSPRALRFVRRAAAKGLIAALAVGLSAPAVPQRLPSMGDGQQMTTAAERRLGDRIARELYRDPDYLDDAVLQEYVLSLWRPLVQAAQARGELTPDMAERFAFEVLLGRDRSVNAFALPGGYFGVHLGLIGIVSNRDELASVLAHEISHVTQRHIARLITRESQQAPWVIGAMILGALAARSNPDAAGALITGGQAVAVQGQLNFSRDMEREADRIGYGLMEQAGFDPLGFVTMFDKLGAANRLSDSGLYPYLRSHPLTTERLADMQARLGVSRLNREGLAIRPGDLAHALLAARARVLAAVSVDANRAFLAEADEARQQLVRGTRATPADTRKLAASLYGGALAAQRSRDAARVIQYLGALEPLLQGDDEARRQARWVAWEWALQSGDLPLAGTLAAAAEQAGLARRPELMLWAQTLLRTGGAQRVTERLQLWVSREPRDAPVWLLLSRGWHEQGQTVRAVRAEAEAFAARFDYPAASDRLRSAQDLLRAQAQPDHIEASILDTRTRQVESLRREQALER